ncbi:MAG TPA: hypothetical protein VJR02_02940 [Pyrinomonadaceae bacterium]|nr:hypothetical protein [Pyrinomonadaceae bacterium]
MRRSEMLANYVIGAIGALGQAALLSKTLTNYPFGILMSPPGRFYSSVGLVLVFVAPALSLLALRVFRRTPAPFITAIPVVACPLLFFVLFRIIFILSGYHYPPHGNDVIATSATEAGFVSEVLWLTYYGLMIGVLCGFVIMFISRSPERGSV